MRPCPTLILIATFALVGSFSIGPVKAGTIESPACKRDLAKTWSTLNTALKRLDGLPTMSQEDKCAAIANQREAATAAREVFARCHTGQQHTDAIRNVDDVLDEVRKTFNRVCPPRPGFVRVNMVETRLIAPDEMPRDLRRIHRCDAYGRITFMNEPFDDGRIMLAGCSGADANEAEAKRRNVSIATAGKDQVQAYLALDSTGRGARRLSFPIIGADGKETAVDALPQTGTMPTGRNTIVGNWAPAAREVCRIHAEWRVDAGKANLVLWQEVVDCSKSGPPAFRTVLDRRAEK